MVAGDLVNTASPAPVGRRPGHRPRRRGDPARRAAGRSPSRRPASRRSRARPRPVPAWRALRVVAERGGRNRAETLEAPFVGRDDELRLLKDLFHATGREQRARLVSVIGPGRDRQEPPRLGVPQVRRRARRDRLVARRPLPGLRRGDHASGRSARWSAAGAGLLETDDEATTRAKVAETLAEHVPDPEERRWIEPALLALLGRRVGRSAPSSSSAPGGRSSSGSPRPAPVVLVFEDLHWADAGLLDFIDHLLEWSRTPPDLRRHPRPAGAPRAAPGLGRRQAQLHLALPRAAARAGDARAPRPASCPGLPEAAVRAIVARADGIPLYAVETVRMLLADGRLAARGRRLPPGRRPDDARGARDAHRAHRLAPRRARPGRPGARLGRRRPRPELHARRARRPSRASPRPSSSRACAALVRRELLTLEADPRSPGARPVRLRPGAHPRGRLQHARQDGPQGPPPRRGPLLREPRHRRARRRARRPLPGRLPERARGPGGRRARRPGPARPAGGRRPGRRPRLARPGRSRSSSRPSTVTTDAAERADLLERAGGRRPCRRGAGRRGARLPRRIERWKRRGERANAARTTAALASAFLTLYRMSRHRAPGARVRALCRSG